MLRNGILLWDAFIFHAIISSLYTLAAFAMPPKHDETSLNRESKQDYDPLSLIPHIEAEKPEGRLTPIGNNYLVAEGYEQGPFLRRTILSLQWKTTLHVRPGKVYQVPVCDSTLLNSALTEWQERTKKAKSVMDELVKKWQELKVTNVSPIVANMKDPFEKFLYLKRFYALLKQRNFPRPVDDTKEWVAKSLSDLLLAKERSGVFGRSENELSFFKFQTKSKSMKLNYPRTPQGEIHFTLSYKNKGEWGEKQVLKEFNVVKVMFPTYFLNHSLSTGIERSKKKLAENLYKLLDHDDQIDVDSKTKSVPFKEKTDAMLRAMKGKLGTSNLENKLKTLGEIVNYQLADYEHKITSYTTVMLEFLSKFCAMVRIPDEASFKKLKSKA